MSTNPRNPDTRPAAVPLDRGASRRKWLIPLLLAVLAVIALLLLLSRCGDDDKKETASTATTQATTAATTPATATAEPSADASAQSGAGEQGAVTAAGANLLGTANAENLSANDGGEAVARSVQVQSVPADEGFWVGSSEQDRLWVQLTGTRGESDYKVEQGDKVDFTGKVTRAAAGFAAKAGLSAAEGADQLTDQKFYISVPASSVKLSD